MLKQLVILLCCICHIGILSAQNHWVLTNINVVSVENGEVLQEYTIEVYEDRLRHVVPTKDFKFEAGVRVIDGEQGYLVPGLGEMHAHIPVPENEDDTHVRETLFLFLANGITTIRGMLGHPYHLDLKKQVASHQFPGPRIYTSSPSLNGNTVKTTDEARQKVSTYASEGYDFLKIHPGIQRPVFDTLVSTANRVGITFSGHVPMDVGIEHAIASKYATIDHLDGYIEGLVPSNRRPDGGFFGVLLAEEADSTRIADLVEATDRAEIAVVPTQTLMTRWLSPTSAAEMVSEPEMKYISPSLRFAWRQNKEQLLDQLDYASTTYRRFLDLRHAYLRAFHRAGVPILLGSDAPQVGNVPGYSLHHEMEAMVSAGLPTLAVLRSGTLNIARFFDAGDQGSIREGYIADIVLLEDNPLTDIGNMQKIKGVAYRGHWLSRQEIDQKLSQIEIKYRSE